MGRVTLLRMRSCINPILQSLLFAITAGGSLLGQSASLEKLTEELLDVPVEAPDWQEHLRARLKEGWVPPPLPDRVPQDDAPIAELVQFWQVREWRVARTVKPSEKVAERLREYGESNPESFQSLRVYFNPESKADVDRVQRLLAKLPENAPVEESQSIESWLMLKAKVLPDLLKQRAVEAFDHPADRSKHEALSFLVQHDWPAAEVVVKRFAMGDQAGARGLALTLLYQHSLSDARSAQDKERARAELQRFVESNEAPDVRANALESLNELDWPGRAEWILDRFKDEALSKVERPTPSYGSHTMVFCDIVKKAPDFWAPKVIPLVGSGNRTAHNNAVDCLIQFHLEDTREDALRPLLPWLSNPDWATSVDGYGRLRLIQSLDRFAAPESVSGLIWVLEHGQDFELSGAAEALMFQEAKESVPALKKALSKESDPYHRRAIIRALLKFNGLSPEERVDAVVAYAVQVSTEQGREALSQASLGSLLMEKNKQPIPSQVSVGESISDTNEQDDALVKQLLKRTKEIATTQPVVAGKLREIIGGWYTDSSMDQIMEELHTNALSKETVQRVLSNRESSAKPLASASDFHGEALVIQALVTSDQKRITSILQGDDPAMQAFLCACARLDRTRLTLPDVAKLLTSKNALLARAAGSYLECDDSPEARTRWQEQHRGEARILGALMRFDPGHFSFYQFSDLEAELRRRVLEKDGPDEVYALLSAGYWGDDGQCVIERYGDHAALMNEQGGGRYRTRDLSEKEFQSLRQFLTAHQIEELPPLNLSVLDGIQYEYLRLTRDGGRRVFMNNPGTLRRNMEMPEGLALVKKWDPDDTVYLALVEQFRNLLQDLAKMRLAYHGQRQFPGLKILIPGETAGVHAMVQQNDQLIVLANFPDENHPQWRVFSEGQLRPDKVDSPGVILSRHKWLPEGFVIADHLVNEAWRASLDEGLVLPAVDAGKQEGLWIASPQHAPKLLMKGSYASPLVTRNKRWVIAAKQLGESRAQPNSLVRIDAKTGVETEIRIEPADTLQPIAVLPDHGKVLVHRESGAYDPFAGKSVDPVLSEHWLYDAETDKVERVSGEFKPLHDQSWRPLQSTVQPHVVWASLIQQEKHSVTTQVGRYDLQKFKFDPVLTLPGLRFTSMDLWVDEKAKLVYITVNGDLLSIPLP